MVKTKLIINFDSTYGPAWIDPPSNESLIVWPLGKLLKILVMKRLLLLACFAFILLSCSGGNYEQVAYYKNDFNFRVFVYVTPETDLGKIRQHAEKQTYTSGSTTAVYYYNELVGSTKSVTFAKDAMDAQDRACTKECIAGYWKFPTGKVSFYANPYGED